MPGPPASPDPGRDRPTKGGWVLGIDEAGRGSVLGPLVVGGFAVRTDDAHDLPAMGVRDSKLLSPPRREELFDRLADVGRRYWLAIPPAQIDRHVRNHRLNQLEARAFGRIVRRAAPDRVIVDACDTDAGRFGRAVARFARVPEDRLDSRHKADRDEPVVAAASIVAKVQRDRAMRKLARGAAWDLGSGYPSDPTTRRAVSAILASGAAPGWLRRSWSTTETLMPKPAPRALESFGP